MEDLDMNKISLEAGSSDYGTTTDNTNLDDGGISGTTHNTNLVGGNSGTTHNTNLDDGSHLSTSENTIIDGGGSSAATENINVDGGGCSVTQIERKPHERKRCRICFQKVSVNKMHERLPCHHRFCFACMARYVEYDLNSYRFPPRCPLPYCASPLPRDFCEKLLSPKLLETYLERLEEAAIPESEKVYCPYPNCSALMALSTLQRCPQDPSSSSSSCSSSVNPLPPTTATKCKKCKQLFCIECRAAWHKDMTCDDYASQMCGADAELYLLAGKNKWKRCPNCKRVIERTKGCSRMCCRCGCEFCYQCGRKWTSNESCDCDFDE